MKSNQQAKAENTQVKSDAEIIAIRKTCDAEGTGLSHYILMDKQGKS